MSQFANRIISEVSQALRVKSFVFKAAVKVSVAPQPKDVSDAKAQSGATAAPTKADYI